MSYTAESFQRHGQTVTVVREAETGRFASLKQCVTFIFTWQALGPNPCPQCLSLNGKTWTDQTIWQPSLIDEVYGPIWDFASDMPLTHGHTGINCHCYLDISYNVNVENLAVYQELTGKLHEMMGAF